MRIDSPAAAAARPGRLPWLDAVRGVAFTAMAIYHFAWDLGYFGYIAVDVTVDLGWRIFARSIAGTFLALVGVSLVLAARNGLNRARFVRRLGVVAASAAGVTVVTWLIFPEMFVFFGILHSIALSSVLGLAFVGAPVPAIAAAAGFSFVAPWLLSAPFFDAPALLWLGLFTERPRSVDYVPIFPWFGVVLTGMVAARLAPALARHIRPSRGLSGPGRLVRLRARLLGALAWAGRNSLALYLIHQPLLFGLVYLAAQVAPPDLAAFEPAYLESCRASCVESGVGENLCQETCACLVERAKAEELWDGLVRNALSEDQTLRYFALAAECRQGAER